MTDPFDAQIEQHLDTLQHTATHCNILQHTATHYNALQHAATNLQVRKVLTFQSVLAIVPHEERETVVTILFKTRQVCCSVLQCVAVCCRVL